MGAEDGIIKICRMRLSRAPREIIVRFVGLGTVPRYCLATVTNDLEHAQSFKELIDA